MKSPISIAWGLLLLPLATAHFDLNYPGAREADHANQGQFPCGGSNTPSAERSDWSLQGDRIEMRSGHTRTAVQVLLALGNDPGSNFNITLLPTLLQEGPGVLCLPRLRLPEGVRVEDGTNATIQVAADGKTGLYNVSSCLFCCGEEREREKKRERNEKLFAGDFDSWLEDEDVD